MAAEMQASGRVFGFIATCVTGTDAIVLMSLSALFSAVDVELALWVCCGLIALHGLVEMVLGPYLVLKPDAPAPAAGDDQQQQQQQGARNV